MVCQTNSIKISSTKDSSSTGISSGSSRKTLINESNSNTPRQTSQPQFATSMMSMDSISLYMSHLFHAIIYYYCVKFIINEYIHNENQNNDVQQHQQNSSIISSLAFYGVYHRTPYNQMIHSIGVPLIIWTMILYGTYLPFTSSWLWIRLPQQSPFQSSSYYSMVSSFVPKVLQLPDEHRINWATLWVLLYVTLYMYIDMIGACLYTPILYIMYATSLRWSADDRQKQQQQHKQQQIDTMMKKDDDPIDRNVSSLVSSPCPPPHHHHWYGTGQLLRNAFLVHIISWYIQIHWGHAIIEGATPASLVNLGAALMSAPLFAFYEIIWYCGYRLVLQQQVLHQVTIVTEQLCTAGANLRICTHI